MPRTARSSSHEEGIALIEVVISALIAAIVVGGVLHLLSATGKASTEQRRRAQAYAIAQEDQARLRATRIGQLNNEMKPRTVTLNSMPYTVTSTAKFVSDKTGSTTCGSTSGASADYVQVGSSVTWPTMRTGAPPVQLESIVSPVSGSLDPTAGSFLVHAYNAAGTAISGVGVSGTGAGTFSGSTDSNGCAAFGGLPAGTYTITPSLGENYVGPNGEEPEAETVKMTGGSIIPLEWNYDLESKVKLSFSVRNSAGTVVTTTNDSVVAVNTEMTTGARTFGTPGTYVSAVTATPLFPFSGSYSFYAGTCSSDAPETSGILSLKAPTGGESSGVIQMPALYLTVKNSVGTTAEKTSVTGAAVTLTDTKCAKSAKRSYSTIAGGGLSNPAVPGGSYEICASFKPSGSTSYRRLIVSKELKSISGTSLTMDIGGTGSETGTTKTC
jgi:Tfp pilus assembly protein PilV